MSAQIIAFPTKHTAIDRSSRYSIDFSPVDQRGFVILDACVPPWLATKLYNLLTAYREKEIEPVRSGVPAHPVAKFSFDATQHEPRGFFLIETCVPEQLARDFLAAAETERPSTMTA
jgi:hypothetical protein